MKKNHIIDPGALSADTVEMGSGIFLFFLVPLSVPFLFIVVSSLHAGHIRFPSPLLLMAVYLFFLIFFLITLSSVRLIHFSVWKSYLTRLRGLYSGRKTDLPDYRFSLWNDSGLDDSLDEIVEIRETALDSEKKKFSRPSAYWDFAPGFMTVLGSDKKKDAYIREEFKKGRDHMHRVTGGLVQVFFRSDGEEPDNCRRQFDWFSRFSEELNAAVAPFGGVILSAEWRSVSVLVTGGWSGKENAARTLRCAQKIKQLLDGDEEGNEFLLVADFIPLMEGVWSGTDFLRYFSASPVQDRYRMAAPSALTGQLRISTRLVAAVKGGKDA